MHQGSRRETIKLQINLYLERIYVMYMSVCIYTCTKIIKQGKDNFQQGAWTIGYPYFKKVKEMLMSQHI